MRLRKLAATLVVALVSGAAMTSSALAIAVTEDVTWRTGFGAEMTGSESLAATGSAELVTTVGGTPLRLQMSALNCVFCSISNSFSTAVGEGELEYPFVTALTPATCAVSGSSIRSRPLRLKADYMEGSTNYWLFEPRTGTTVATVKLIAGSGSCPLAGSYIVSGKLFVQSSNSTGTLVRQQTVTSSGFINSFAGGELKFGSSSAELNGSATFSLFSNEFFGTL